MGSSHRRFKAPQRGRALSLRTSLSTRKSSSYYYSTRSSFAARDSERVSMLPSAQGSLERTNTNSWRSDVLPAADQHSPGGIRHFIIHAPAESYVNPCYVDSRKSVPKTTAHAIAHIKRGRKICMSRDSYCASSIHRFSPRISVRTMCVPRGGLGRLAAWHLPCGLVGPPARWAATPNFEGVSET